MSYGTSLLTTYPSSYGQSTLLSDDLVGRSSLGGRYEPSVPYMSSSSRLLSDSLAYNQIGLGPTSYHPSPYAHLSATNYRTPSITTWRRDVPPQNSFASLNDVTEYSDSLGTISNSNTASSIARSINDNNLNGSMNIFPNYQQNYNRLLNNVDRSPHLDTIWSPLPTINKTNEEKPTNTYRSLRQLSPTFVQNKSPIEESKTPISSPPITKHESNLQKSETLTGIVKPQSSVDIEAWLNENPNELPVEGKSAEQAWTNKIDHLHIVQAQREKDKAKSSRALPNLTKKVENKPVINRTSAANDNKTRDTAFQMRNDSYFDSLFDGNFFRKSSTNQRNSTSSYQQSFSTRTRPTPNSLNKPTTTIFNKNPKYSPPRKAPIYEPPSINRVQPTNSPRKQLPKQNQNELVTSRYSNNEFTPRDNAAHKDTDERFREALQKFRSDRVEQQQRDFNESTAKRLNYGDYVRRSTKNALLHNVIKPSPWSDFMDLKKGNLISLTKEEKKELYNQSKSYGERVRNRNIALHHGGETDRTPRRTIPLPIENQEPDSGDETSREPENDDNSNELKRSDSQSTIKTTNKTYTKQKRHSASTAMHTNQSSTIRPSEEEDEDISDFETSGKQKKKSRHPKYDSSVRTTSGGTEESENDETSEQRSTRMRNRETDDDLFTVREEKTQESLEGLRYKKR